jgi:hypothetical protein
MDITTISPSSNSNPETTNLQIALIVMVAAPLVAALAYMIKKIKRSTCCGASIEIALTRQNTTDERVTTNEITVWALEYFFFYKYTVVIFMAAHRTKCAKTSVLQRSAPLTRRVMGQDPHHLVDELFRRPPKEPRRKGINTIYTARRPNQIQQADLLYLPEDDGYKYLLVVVDLFDRHVEVEPLKNKDAQTVKDAFIEIYNNTDLKHPKQLQVDSGKEFMGVFKYFFANYSIHVFGKRLHFVPPGYAVADLCA